ncbi:hypothetical protein [Ruminococcus sp. NK3A76]|uniref:hypothetical protein n=1 Tax=Ruminococcus sp. NK3A76 TaxID=877411 RepID=UPI00048C9BFA|nr:hypothetical protein [Ruminococcus sp. NK3A76]
MATRICKSCGAEYKGEYCDKCGYGKPDVTSKALEKMKKDGAKPVRFMTPEEKEAYYAELKKKKISVNRNKKKVKASKGAVLAVFGVLAVIVVISLFATGTISLTSKTAPIEAYFKAIEEKDYAGFANSLHPDVRKQYEEDIAVLGATKDNYMSDYYCKDLEDRYGEGFTIKAELSDPKKLSDDDAKKIGSEAGIDSPKKPYMVDAEVTFSGSKKTETADLTIYVSSEPGGYKIFYLKAAEIPFTEDEMSKGGTNNSESSSQQQ